MNKQAKKRPKPVGLVAKLVQAQEDGHRAGCRASHAVAASWLVDLVAELTGRSRFEVEKELGFSENIGNAHFIRAARMLQDHVRIVPVVTKRRKK